MSNKFIEFLDEAILPDVFSIDLDGYIINIIRTSHLRDIRNGDIKSKDFKMNKVKYKELIDLVKDKISPNKVYTITWLYNSTSNAISINFSNVGITVFGAIMRSNRDYTKLYPKAQNRIHLGTQKF